MIKIVLSFLSNKIWPRYPSLKQFFKFGAVGVLNTATDFIVYFSLTRGINWFGHYYLVANAISFSIAVTQSFFINKYWTFQDTEKNNASFQYFKFFLANVLTLSINQLILYLLVDGFGIYDLFGKILIIVTYTAMNFTLFKFWVFKK